MLKVEHDDSQESKDGIIKIEAETVKIKEEDMSFHTSPECNAPNPPCALPRSDTSLFFLTRRFAEKLSLSVDGVLDLKLVSQELNLSRRRIYDITNVLEGIRLIKKTSKSHIQWLGRSLIDNTNKQLMALAEEEMKLDELIQSCTQQIRKLCEERHIHKYAYLTHTDVRSIQSLRDQTVIVIKAPAETNVQVPHPDESLRVHIRSINGPIEVFVLSESMESSDNTAANGVDDGTLNSTTHGNDSFHLPSTPCHQESSRGRITSSAWQVSQTCSAPDSDMLLT